MIDNTKLMNKISFKKILLGTFLTIAVFFSFVSCESDNDTVNTLTPLDGLNVEITTPNDFESVTPGNAVFKGRIFNPSERDLSHLTAVWSSDIDGVLYNGSVNALGETTFTSHTLSRTIHRITLSIYNESGDLIFDQVQVLNILKLYPIQKTNNSVILKWSSAASSGFQSYKVYRSTDKYSFTEQPLYTTANSLDTTFVDTTPMLGWQYYYKIQLNRNTPVLPVVGSNLDSIVPGKFLKLDFPIAKMTVDPTRNFAYAIVNPGIWENNSTGYGLAMINTTTQQFSDRILTDLRFTDLEIDNSGNYIYLCNNTRTVYKVNLSTRQFVGTMTLSEPAIELEIGTNNKLYYLVGTYSDEEGEFRIYDLNTAANVPYSSSISDAYNHFPDSDFELDSNNVIYVGEANTSGADLVKIGTGSTGNNFQELNRWHSNNYRSKGIYVRRNNLFWDEFQIDSNLNVLGSFTDNGHTETIRGVSPDGNFVITYGNLFDGNSRSLIKKIPVWNYNLVTFANNSHVLLIQNEHPLYEQYTATIYFYDL